MSTAAAPSFGGQRGGSPDRYISVSLLACPYDRILACMQACMHACMHTYIHTYIQTYIHTYIPTYLYIYMYLHAYMHSYIHAYIRTLTYMHTYAHIKMHKYRTATIWPCSYWLKPLASDLASRTHRMPTGMKFNLMYPSSPRFAYINACH